MLAVTRLLVLFYFASTLAAPTNNLTSTPVRISLKKLSAYVNESFARLEVKIDKLKENMAKYEKNQKVLDDDESIPQIVRRLDSLNSSLLHLESLRRHCPVKWTHRGGRCYQFTQCVDTTTCTANDARNSCRKRGGRLVRVTSPDFNEFVGNLTTVSRVIIGGRYDVANKKWVWEDGTPADYTNLGGGLPNYL